MRDVIVISHWDIDSINRQINELIEVGYTLVGRVSFEGYKFTATMVFYED